MRGAYVPGRYLLPANTPLDVIKKFKSKGKLHSLEEAAEKPPDPQAVTTMATHDLRTLPTGEYGVTVDYAQLQNATGRNNQWLREVRQPRVFSLHLEKSRDRVGVEEFLVSIKQCADTVSRSRLRSQTRPQHRPKIALIDSGVSSSLQQEIDKPFRQNFVRQEINTLPADDDCSDVTDNSKEKHGSFLYTIIRSVAGDHSDIYVAKVANGNGEIEEEDAIDAIKHAMDTWKVNVINISFGWSTPRNFDGNGVLERLLRQAVDQGVHVVCSTGNTAHMVSTPGCVTEVLSFGAFDCDAGKILDSSGYGCIPYSQVSKPDLVAPGVLNMSLQGEPTCIKVRGTSHAAAFGSGLVACVLQKMGLDVSPHKAICCRMRRNFWNASPYVAKARVFPSSDACPQWQSQAKPKDSRGTTSDLQQALRTVVVPAVPNVKSANSVRIQSDRILPL